MQCSWCPTGLELGLCVREIHNHGWTVVVVEKLTDFSPMAAKSVN